VPGFERGDRRRLRRRGFVERGDEVAQGIGAETGGTEGDDAPILASAQKRHQPGADQRGFAATRQSDQGNEAPRRELLRKLRDIAFPPEEEPGILLLKRR
jgi:hypothetical protein